MLRVISANVIADQIVGTLRTAECSRFTGVNIPANVDVSPEAFLAQATVPHTKRRYNQRHAARPLRRRNDHAG
jgi:hypothetical protein